jgi:hypothetical protein
MRRDGTAARQENADPRPLAKSSPLVGRGETAADLPGLAWRKSGASTTNGDCVEVASLTGCGMAVRDSKDKDGPILRFSRDEWHQFISGIQDGISQES